jgi:predicted ArsR family transcriptional regulator
VSELHEVTEIPASRAQSVLDRALAYLATHQDSSALQIAQALGLNDRTVFNALDNAAYKGLCQRWRPANPRAAWLWELPVPHDCKADAS